MLQSCKFRRNRSDLFHCAENDLKRLSNGFQNTSEADLKVRLNIQHALAKKLEKKSQKFRRLQSDYGESKEKQELMLSWEEDAFGNNHEDPSSSQTMVDAIVLITEEREDEIQKLTKGLQSLSNVFKEVAGMVIDQGTIIDRIDYNMEQVLVRMTSGVKELRRAENFQKNNRAMKCILILVFMISFCFLTLMAKHSK